MDLGEATLITGDYPVSDHALNLIDGPLQLLGVEYAALLGHEQPFSSDPLAYYNPEVNPKQRLRFIASRWADLTTAPSHLLAIEDVAFLFLKTDSFIQTGGADEASGVHIQSGRLHPLLFQNTKACQEKSPAQASSRIGPPHSQGI